MAGAMMMAQMAWHEDGPAELWEPNDASSLAAWFDASDTSTYTVGGGGAISAPTDKTGNFTMTLTGTPTRVSGDLNSLNTWDFDGNSSLISSNSGPYSNAGNHWAVGLFEWQSVDADKDSFWSAVGTRTYAISSAGGGGNSFPGEIDYDGSNAITGNAVNAFSTGIPSNNWTIVSVIANKTGNQFFARTNGTLNTSVDAYLASMDTTCSDLRMMQNRSGVKLDGRMAEYFHYNTILGTGGTDISTVEEAEGYIAWKWGLQGNLPVGHPYKNAAPTV